ncbi:thioredoxin family protein [Mucilaginibacter defluvii]|uniref:Thioredoxin family protein n=1 Tax=Mucilaginibacter defluvii TaxID=1196019 RepID=A0ABP9FT45_9SPHI
MTYEQYHALFGRILSDPSLSHPYDNEAYLEYTKLNSSRMRRRDKQLSLDKHLMTLLQRLELPQHWIIITEPWCGDAAHILPFLIRMTTQNPLITYDIQLRDSSPFLIDSYLTEGAKSIPKLIVRNMAGEDLFNWGPRPKPAQKLLKSLTVASVDPKIALQNWYNQNKGVSINVEITQLFQQLNIR